MPHLKKVILVGEPIKLFSNGNHTRDFTCGEDLAEGVIRASDQVTSVNLEWSRDAADTATSNAPFRIFNFGNYAAVKPTDRVEALKEARGCRAERKLLPLRAGDGPDSVADVATLERAVGCRITTTLQVGIAKSVALYRTYYGV